MQNAGKSGGGKWKAGQSGEEVVVEAEMKSSKRSAMIAACLTAAVAWGSLVPAAQASETKEAGNDFGIGMVTVLANVVYMPVKVTYGLLGGVTGGFAYVLSGANREVADGVWVPSLGGDYVLTTDMMTGHDKVQFNGIRERSAYAEEDGRLGGEQTAGGSF